MTDTARVIDYAHAENQFIPLRNVEEKMSQLRQGRLVISLFGLDFSLVLTSQVRKQLENVTFVHCANTIVYLQPELVFQMVFNCLECGRNDAIVKLHNDPNLPYDPLLYSLTAQKRSKKLNVLAQVTY